MSNRLLPSNIEYLVSKISDNQNDIYEESDL